MLQNQPEMIGGHMREAFSCDIKSPMAVMHIPTSLWCLAFGDTWEGATSIDPDIVNAQPMFQE